MSDPSKDAEPAAEAARGRSPSPSPAEAGALATLLGETAAMIRFFSRLPCPRLSACDDPAAPPPFGRAIRMLPLAAIAIAAPGAAVLAGLAPSGLSGLVVAALAVAVSTMVTGALHEDGFADVADGFGGGATRERALEIMKDSRIGAFGGLALAAQFVLRAGLLAELLDRLDGAVAGVAIGAAVLARVVGLAPMVLLEPARADGLGRAAGGPEPAAYAIALAGGVAVFALAGVTLVGPAETLAGLTATAAAVGGLLAWAKAKIGGFTGDVVGAAVIAAEIAALIGLSL